MSAGAKTFLLVIALGGAPGFQPIRDDARAIGGMIAELWAQRPHVPPQCWFWTYLAACWLYIGPRTTRLIYREPVWRDWWWKDEEGRRTDPETTIGEFPLTFVWLLSPLWFPIWLTQYLVRYVVLPPLNLLMLGRGKP